MSGGSFRIVVAMLANDRAASERFGMVGGAAKVARVQ